MIVHEQGTFRGRKSRVGKVTFDTGKMTFFLGYHDCPNCNTHNKLLVGIDEARAFASKFGHSRVKLKHRIGKHLINS